MALNQSPRPARQLPLLVGMLSLLIVAVGVWVAWRFNADVAAARGRAMQGGVIAQTRCGPIEYQEAGQGLPLLIVHGSGGGHDQGMAFGRPFAQQGM